MHRFSLNINGNLHEYTQPIMMGILNVTPDSFYSASRAFDADSLHQRVRQIVDEGAEIIDIGAFSTRPGFADVTESEELRRLELATAIVREISQDILISVDTFRASVARTAVKSLSADIINDVTGGNGDSMMLETVAALHVPYVLTHMRGTVDTMHNTGGYQDFLADFFADLSKKLKQINRFGLKDVILDPGFGFSKSIDENYRLLNSLNLLTDFHMPVLVGVSRKSMVTTPLGITAEESLVGTSVLNTLAIERGASILRVHDVKAAKQTIKLCELSHIL